MLGRISFDYSNNNGLYIFGAGDMAFETKWSAGSHSQIHAYNYPQSIRTVALALGIKEIIDVIDASSYDNSSRTRAPYLGEIVVWLNTAGYYLATKVVAIGKRDLNGGASLLTLEYKIALNKSVSFA
jgi:hypothetical protein